MKHPVVVRLLMLLRIYVVLLLLFVVQKWIFMLFNLGHADGLTLIDWLSVAWHGLALDSVTACYILCFPMLMMWVSVFVPRLNLMRVLTPYYIIVSLMMALAFIADVVMYRFWGLKIEANDLMYTAHPKEMLASVSEWFVAFVAIVLGLVTLHYIRQLRYATKMPPTRPPRWPWIFLFVLLGGLQFVGMRGGVGESVANPGYAYFSSKPFLNHAALNPLFNMLHSMTETEDFATEFQYYDRDEVEQVAQQCYYDDAALTDTLLRTSRPDILLIVWEGGGSQMVLNDTVAPNLMALCGEGVFFDNCYANGHRTDRGLVSIFSGWPCLPTTSLMKMPDMCRKLPAFPQLLREAGYNTSFRYGGDVDFTNMRGYLYEAGFSKVEGDESFPGSRNQSNWGAPDEYLLRADQLPADSGFFAAWLTLSSHEPWQVPIRRCTDDKRNAFAYTDSCLGALVHTLRQSPRWDNLLIIVVPDHGVPVEELQWTDSPEVAAIPVLWLGGAVRRPMVIHRLMNQSDLAATLLAQLHIAATPLTFSRNVLSPTYDSATPVAIHTYSGGLNYFDTLGCVSYDCVAQMATAFNPATDTDALRLRRLKALLQLIYLRTGDL